MKWNIDILDPRGNSQRHTVDALTQASALETLGIPAHRILRVRRAWLSALVQHLTAVHLSSYDQVTLLSTLSAAAASGQRPDPVLADFIDSNRSLRRKKEALMAPDRLSDQLRLLNLDDQAVTLVSTGEDSGDLGGALRRAAAELGYRTKLLARVRSKLIMPSMILVSALLALTILPVYFVPVLREFQQSGLGIHVNVATRIIIFISEAVTTRWYYLCVFIVALVFWRRAIWAYLKRIPVISPIDEYVMCLRSLTFITLFRPLYSRGISVESILQTQIHNSGEGGKRVYQDMLDQINSGIPLSRTLSERFWPKFMRFGLSGFESAVPEAKERMLESIHNLMVDRVDALGGRISGVLTGVGMLFGATTVLLLAFGIYYPMITASTMG